MSNNFSIKFHLPSDHEGLIYLNAAGDGRIEICGELYELPTDLGEIRGYIGSGSISDYELGDGDNPAPGFYEIEFAFHHEEEGKFAYRVLHGGKAVGDLDFFSDPLKHLLEFEVAEYPTRVAMKLQPSGNIAYYAKVGDIAAWGFAGTGDRPSEDKYFVLDGMEARAWWAMGRPSIDSEGRFGVRGVMTGWFVAQAREVTREEYLVAKSQILMGHCPSELEIASLPLPDWAVERPGDFQTLAVWLAIFDRPDGKRDGLIYADSLFDYGSDTEWVSSRINPNPVRLYALDQKAVFEAVYRLSNKVKGTPTLYFTEKDVYLRLWTDNEPFMAFVGRRAA